MHRAALWVHPQVGAAKSGCGDNYSASTAEVGKLLSNTLRPTHKPLTQPVGDTVYTTKKCVIEERVEEELITEGEGRW